MISTFWRIAVQLSRRLYVRVLMIALLSVLSLLVAKLLDPLIPEGLADVIGAKAVDPILQTLASSMLAVSIFSLTIMTGAFRTASSQWSPRTHVILKDDTTTHSVLASFVGAYLFALMAIVLRSTHFFGEKEIVVLFGFTIGVIVLIVANLILWIAHLEELGSLDKTGNQVQRRAEAAMREIAKRPCYGAQSLNDPDSAGSGGRKPVRATRAGYVQQIFQDRLQDSAEAEDVRIFVVARIGAYLQAGEVLAHVEGDADAVAEAVRMAVVIDSTRSFQQDPGFGVLVLTEIASRALSPGINDPQTAIDMVNRLATVLAQADPPHDREAPRLDRVWMVPPDLDGFFRMSFDRIARDAGGMVEVHQAIAEALKALSRTAGPTLAAFADAGAARCALRAEMELDRDPDLARYRSETD